MNNERVRTRFAPSPTGFIHIGNARAALFAYLWAKKNNGDFILRIEDTDKERYVEGSVEAIKEGLEWLGINWDEGPDKGGEYGPYTQSERLDIYTAHADQLIASKKAYRCFCTPDRLTKMRSEQQEKKLPPRYDGACRDLSDEEIKKQLDNNSSFVVRLRVPEEGSVEVDDAVHGKIIFDVKDIDDQVLIKSDGYPTYHLANIVDDHLMRITHVIRGEEWIPSTPKHVLLYQAFGWECPTFVHLTVFLSKSGGKMSKRDGDTALLSFRETGYLPEAIVNFIALLGWNPKTEEEFFLLRELTDRFDLSMINKANPVFETDKLIWMNQHYLKQMSLKEFKATIEKLGQSPANTGQVYRDFQIWFTKQLPEKQESIWDSLKNRLKVLSDIQEILDILNKDLTLYQAENLVWKKSDKKATITILEKLIKQIQSLAENDFIVELLEKNILQWIKESEWGNGDVLWPMRYALTGEAKSPSPFECAELLGKDETLTRLNIGLNKLKQ